MKKPKWRGMKLRVERIKLGLSQHELAARAGIWQQAVSLYERGLVPCASHEAALWQAIADVSFEVETGYVVASHIEL